MQNDIEERLRVHARMVADNRGVGNNVSSLPARYYSEAADTIAALRAEVERLRKAVNTAEVTFLHYGDLHAVKPDEAKAKRNYDLADEMRAALKGQP